MESFYDLLIYQRSYKTALEVHKISKQLPKDEQFALTSQIRRASKSIPANIAEGYGKRHTSSAEFKRFLQIAIGSTNEMLVWLDFCSDLNYVEKENIEKLKSEYQEIAKMIFSLHRNWEKKAA